MSKARPDQFPCVLYGINHSVSNFGSLVFFEQAKIVQSNFVESLHLPEVAEFIGMRRAVSFNIKLNKVSNLSFRKICSNELHFRFFIIFHNQLRNALNMNDVTAAGDQNQKHP